MKRSDCTDPFLRGYIDAALFTTDPYPPGGCDYVESGRADELWPMVPREFIAQAVADCVKFQSDMELVLIQAGEPSRNGHDFWLSRNGHGAGFYDRDYGENGDALQTVSETYGEHDLILDEAALALEKSIEHWQRLVDNYAHEEPGVHQCALCKKFKDNETDGDCSGCPVYEHTGKEYCKGTPYEAAQEAWDNGNDDAGGWSEEFAELAKEELEFLESLRKNQP